MLLFAALPRERTDCCKQLAQSCTRFHHYGIPRHAHAAVCWWRCWTASAAGVLLETVGTSASWLQELPAMVLRDCRPVLVSLLDHFRARPP